MKQRFYSIIYPGYLQLIKNVFLNFKFEGKEIKFILNEHRKSLMIFDPFNEFIYDDKQHVKILKDYKLGTAEDSVIYSKNGNTNDPYSFQVVFERFPAMRVFYNLRCSHLFFIVETDQSNPDFDFASRLIRHFILIYKRTINDVFVKNFEELKDAYLSIESGECIPKPGNFFDFKTDSLQALWNKYMDNQPYTNYDPEKAFIKVGENLKLENTLDDRDIFIKAYEEIYVKGNFKYALLDAFIFIEQIISAFLKSIKLSKGISNNTLKGFQRDIGISYMLNVELPLVMEDHASHKDLFTAIDGIRKKRNDVIHEGESVAIEEAKDAVENAYKLHRLLKSKVKN